MLVVFKVLLLSILTCLPLKWLVSSVALTSGLQNVNSDYLP